MITRLKLGALTEVPEQRASSPNCPTMKIAPFWLNPAAVGSETVSVAELAPAPGEAAAGGSREAKGERTNRLARGSEDERDRARLIRCGVQKPRAATCETCRGLDTRPGAASADPAAANTSRHPSSATSLEVTLADVEAFAGEAADVVG